MRSIDQATQFLIPLASEELWNGEAGDTEVDISDVRRAVDTIKYGVQAIDDLDGLTARHHRGTLIALADAKPSTPQKFLNATFGVFAPAEGVQDQDAQKLIAGARNMLGEVPGLGPTDTDIYIARRLARLGYMPTDVTVPLDIPGEIAANMINVTREGADKVNETMRHVSDAINGDPLAAKRAVEASQGIRKILSSESYGNAIRKGLTDRLIDHVPGLRTVMNWFG